MPISRHQILSLIIGGLVVFALGCPYYRDDLSGTFREVVDPEFPSEELVAVELIRFGDHVQTITRFYPWTNRSDQLFSEETRCMWSEAGLFAEETRFDLKLDTSFGGDPLRARGRIDEDSSGDPNLLSLRIETGEGTRELQLARVGEEPDFSCDQVKPIVVRGYFGDGELSEQYEMSNPVMSVFWVGLASVRNALVGINSLGSSVRLKPQHHLLSNRRGLKNWEVLWATPPKEPFLMTSGDTRFALAYMVVIDDAESENNFLWESAEEPIVGSSIRPIDRMGQRMWEGKAILYVEGDLRELGSDLLSLMEGVVDANPQDHFYICDLETNALEEIRRIVLPESRTQNAVPIRVDDERIDNLDTDFPRFWHLWSPESL
jgi:hypothetical protein